MNPDIAQADPQATAPRSGGPLRNEKGQRIDPQTGKPLPGRPARNIPPEELYQEKANIPIGACKAVAGIVPFSIVAFLAKDPAFNLTEGEKQSLADAWKQVLDKHVPPGLAANSPEIILGLSIAALVSKKAQESRERKEKAKHAEQHKSDTPADGQQNAASA